MGHSCTLGQNPLNFPVWPKASLVLFLFKILINSCNIQNQIINFLSQTRQIRIFYPSVSRAQTTAIPNFKFDWKNYTLKKCTFGFLWEKVKKPNMHFFERIIFQILGKRLYYKKAEWYFWYFCIQDFRCIGMKKMVLIYHKNLHRTI